ncbi:MAG: glycosyltransferase, partial [Candidatus Nanopelagicales bacterium]|nr:glycosyltransferase [Candidatus Nanopelagicales bacterium]
DNYWRALQPVLIDFEEAYVPVIDKFRPDVIHAHDFRMVGIAVRAAARAKQTGRTVSVIYDAHEFAPGLEGTDEFVVGNANYEAAHIRLADRVVTVSEPLADLLQKHHGLDRRPLVTLNAPEDLARNGDPEFTRDIRHDCGLSADTPLLVYSGGVARRRGLETAAAGLVHLPGVHLAIIASADPEGRTLIRKAARKAGTTDRVHFQDFVPRSALIQHLRTADIAVHPLLHLPNHEIALPNKFFDYVFAGLPMVVSDVEHLAETVQKCDVGRSFIAGDPEDFARAVREVLADLPRLRENVRACPRRSEWTWESQEPVLAELYAGLQTGLDPQSADHAGG